MAYNFNTFGDVVEEAYRELSIDSSSTSIPGIELSEMERWANRFSKIFLEKVHLKTQDDTYPFITRADTTLASAAASGAVSLTLSDTVTNLVYPSSGMILLDGTPFAYSAFTGTTMTVEALDRAYDAGDVIQLGYAVPTNFAKSRGLFVENQRYFPYKWGTTEKVPEGKFGVFNDYIFLPEAIALNQDVILHFHKKATNTLTTASTMEIYQMWDAYVIYRLAARGHRLLYDSNRADEYEKLAIEMLRGAQTQAANEDVEPNRGFVPGW